MKSLRIPTACASLALLLALHGRAAAASSEIQGPAILEHACGKTAVKHMGLVRAGNMVEAVKLGTQEMREEWKAMPEEDRLMMSVMLSKMSLTSRIDGAVCLISRYTGPDAMTSVWQVP